MEPVTSSAVGCNNTACGFYGTPEFRLHCQRKQQTVDTRQSRCLGLNPVIAQVFLFVFLEGTPVEDGCLLFRTQAGPCDSQGRVPRRGPCIPMGKGTWVHVMTSDNIQCVFHIRVRETPGSSGRLFAAVGTVAGWGFGLVHGRQPQAPAPVWRILVLAKPRS